MKPTDRIILTIDIAAIVSNYHSICAWAAPANVMAVVKGNAYGHGLSEVVSALVSNGANRFGVATLDEAEVVRRLAPDSNIYLLAPTGQDCADACVKLRLIPMVSTISFLQALNRAAGERGVRSQAHIEIDVGMGRAGMSLAEARKALTTIWTSLEFTGIATHFPRAESNPEETRRQWESFETIVSELRELLQPDFEIHASNSAASLSLKESQSTMIRPGLLLYGIMPTVAGTFQVPLPNVQPAATLHAKVIAVRTLPAGHTIGYGDLCRLTRETTVATLSVGHGDGYPRRAGMCGHVLIQGQRCPLLGWVSMDTAVADVTELPEIASGEIVTLLGQDGSETIRVNDISAWAETADHAVIILLTPRVRRINKND